MQIFLLPFYAIALSLALIWFPGHFLVSVAIRMRQTRSRILNSVCRALLVLGFAGLIFNIVVVFQIVTGRLALVLAENWALIGALVVVWMTFWARLAVRRLGRKLRYHDV